MFGEVSVVKVVAVEGAVGDRSRGVGRELSRVQREGEETAKDLFRRMVDQGGARFVGLEWRR